MSKIVEKWAACTRNGILHVAKGHFKVTPKRLKREGGSHADQMDLALYFKDQLDRETDLLHDTAEEALDALHSRKMQEMQRLRSEIEKIQGELSLIDDYEVSK